MWSPCLLLLPAHNTQDWQPEGEVNFGGQFQKLQSMVLQLQRWSNTVGGAGGDETALMMASRKQQETGEGQTLSEQPEGSPLRAHSAVVVQVKAQFMPREPITFLRPTCVLGPQESSIQIWTAVYGTLSLYFCASSFTILYLMPVRRLHLTCEHAVDFG